MEQEKVRKTSGKDIELVAEMKKFWLKILGISEVKVRGHGEKAISDARCVFGG